MRISNVISKGILNGPGDIACLQKHITINILAGQIQPNKLFNTHKHDLTTISIALIGVVNFWYPDTPIHIAIDPIAITLTRKVLLPQHPGTLTQKLGPAHRIRQINHIDILLGSADHIEQVIEQDQGGFGVHGLRQDSWGLGLLFCLQPLIYEGQHLPVFGLQDERVRRLFWALVVYLFFQHFIIISLGNRVIQLIFQLFQMFSICIKLNNFINQIDLDKYFSNRIYLISINLYFDIIQCLQIQSQNLNRILYNIIKTETIPNEQIKMTNLQTFKFTFTAHIGLMTIKAKISSPTFVTWKRSQESAVSQVVELVDGKADFGNEVLRLPVNMYFDRDANCFQEKKSSFSFTMKTPKGEKTAGVVYVDLSKMLNNKLTQIDQQFPLQKCPVKDSTVRIKITSECLGEKSNDTQSQASVGINQSTISLPSASQILSKSELPAPQPSPSQTKSKPSSSNATPTKSTTVDESAKDQQIKQLKKKVEQLTKQNHSLKKQLDRAKQTVKGDSLRQELLKSKSLQDRLEEEVNALRKQNLDHQRELEEVRAKMEDAYTNLYSNLKNIL